MSSRDRSVLAALVLPASPAGPAESSSSATADHSTSRAASRRPGTGGSTRPSARSSPAFSGSAMSSVTSSPQHSQGCQRSPVAARLVLGAGDCEPSPAERQAPLLPLPESAAPMPPAAGRRVQPPGGPAARIPAPALGRLSPSGQRRRPTGQLLLRPPRGPCPAGPSSGPAARSGRSRTATAGLRHGQGRNRLVPQTPGPIPRQAGHQRPGVPPGGRGTHEPRPRDGGQPRRTRRDGPARTARSTHRPSPCRSSRSL